MGSVLIEMSGRRFGRLLVVERTQDRGGRAAWRCQCDCGLTTDVVGKNLRTGNTRSCGCFHDERCRERATKHQSFGTREYRAWCAAKTRCYNQQQRTYASYGGRGIAMADEWRDDFRAFLRDMGPCPTGHTLDRINVNGDYAPGNCRWATLRQQANNCRSNRVLEFGGQRHTVAEWARLTGMAHDTLKRRVLLGWTADRALTEPVRRWPTAR